jgi:hypothetical protein
MKLAHKFAEMTPENVRKTRMEAAKPLACDSTHAATIAFHRVSCDLTVV